MSYSMLIIFGSLFQTGPWPINPKVSSFEVTADTSSNKSFKCTINVDPDYCADVLELQWRFNDSSAPIKSGKKYKIQEKNTNSKCKKEFTLTINNVTVEDKGNYSCQSICYEETTFAVFELKVKGETLSKFLTNQAPSFAYWSHVPSLNEAVSRHKSSSRQFAPSKGIQDNLDL